MIPDRPLREEIFSRDLGWKEVREVRERYEVDVEGRDRCYTYPDRRGPGGPGGPGTGSPAAEALTGIPKSMADDRSDPWMLRVAGFGAWGTARARRARRADRRWGPRRGERPVSAIALVDPAEPGAEDAASRWLAGPGRPECLSVVVTPSPLSRALPAAGRAQRFLVVPRAEATDLARVLAELLDHRLIPTVEHLDVAALLDGCGRARVVVNRGTATVHDLALTAGPVVQGSVLRVACVQVSPEAMDLSALSALAADADIVAGRVRDGRNPIFANSVAETAVACLYLMLAW